MSRDYEPVPGQWYENLEDEESFRVLTVDEDALYDEVTAARAALAPAVSASQAAVAPLEGPIHSMWQRIMHQDLGFQPGADFR